MLRRSTPRLSGGTEIIEKWNPGVFKKTCVGGSVAAAACIGAGYVGTGAALGGCTALFAYRGYKDMKQVHSTLLRNFPVLAHARYLLEGVRGELRQYLIEDDLEERPFSRAQRSLVYQRAKEQSDLVPFGTIRNVNEPGADYVVHSLFPKDKLPLEKARVVFGEGQCAQPYSASILNISAMSYGALSEQAVRALSGGAMLGGFYHNTGEGSVSRFHIDPTNAPSDKSINKKPHIVWNIGSGYFGCRNKDGTFSLERFKEVAAGPDSCVKMIEIKLSQGAKPGKGGTLPAAKCTPEIAAARGLEPWTSVYSPSKHSAFHNCEGLLEFAAKLREASGGKPVGIKMCVGDPVEVALLIRKSQEMKLYLDFITVDGSEGGTGAAPAEFTNRVGTPLSDGLYLVHNLLRGAGIRQHTKVIASGKVYSGFTLFRNLHSGADVCNSARAMMMALGCIQARECHAGTCPTGVTSAGEHAFRATGLDLADKRVRVANFHRNTVSACLDLVAASGFNDLSELRSRPVIMTRTGPGNGQFLTELYPKLKHEELLDVPISHERLASYVAGQSMKDRLMRAWIISGDPDLMPKVKLYGRN